MIWCLKAELASVWRLPLTNLQTNRINLLLGVVLLFPFSGSAQDLQGRFSSEKDSYMVGEPALFNVEIKNSDTEVVYLHAKNPDKCQDTYEFFVQGAGSGCGHKWDTECADEPEPLAPGDTFRGQWPLNYWFQFDHDGKYEVTATRHIPIRSTRGTLQDFTFSSKFEIKIDPVDPARVQSILQVFERNLHSTDPDVRHSALDVLATTAPDYFQAVALRLARDEDAFVVMHAVGALGRINTPETRAALADVITTGEATTDDQKIARIRAIEALGRGGDSGYEGLIGHYLDDKYEFIQLAAMVAVAELGKAEAVPQLQRFFSSADPVVRKNAAYALRFSLTPEAVEALIDAIADKDVKVRERVLTSLNELTGHSVGDSALNGASPEKLQEAWRSWWRTNKGKLTLPEHLEFLCHL
jgi:hypothetical protein